MLKCVVIHRATTPTQHYLSSTCILTESQPKQVLVIILGTAGYTIYELVCKKKKSTFSFFCCLLFLAFAATDS